MRKGNKRLAIEVEACTNCSAHSWCSRHDQAKYNQYFEMFKSKVESVLGYSDVVKNNVPSSYRKINDKVHGGENRYFDLRNNEIVLFPKFGAFEVYVNGILIFSKLKSSLWPNLDRLAHLIDAMAKAQDQGQDLNTFSLDYRLANDQNEHFVDTYKAEIVKQLSSSRQRAFSQQKSPSSGKANFKSRKIITRSKNKEAILENSSQGSPIINRSKFNPPVNKRPESRDKHVHTLENQNSKDELSEDRKKEVDIHQWNIVDKKEKAKEERPVIRKGDLQSLLEKKTKMGENSPKIQLNTSKSKQLNELKEKKKEDLSNGKIKGWTDKETSSGLLINKEKSEKEKLQKKPSINEKIGSSNGFNNEFIIEDDVSQKQREQRQKEKEKEKEKEREREKQKEKQKQEEKKRQEEQKKRQIEKEKKAQQELKLKQEKQKQLKAQQQRLQQLNSKKVMEQLDKEYSSDNFEEAKSQISWQFDQIDKRYPETIQWQALVQKGSHIYRLQPKQQKKPSQTQPISYSGPIQHSQIIKHHNKKPQQPPIQPTIQPAIHHEPAKWLNAYKEEIHWLASFKDKKYGVQRVQEGNERLDEEYSAVEEFGLDEGEEEVGYDQFVEDLEDEHQAEVQHKGLQVMVIKDDPVNKVTTYAHADLPATSWEARRMGGQFILLTTAESIQAQKAQSKPVQPAQDTKPQQLPQKSQTANPPAQPQPQPQPKDQAQHWIARYKDKAFILQTLQTGNK